MVPPCSRIPVRVPTATRVMRGFPAFAEHRRIGFGAGGADGGCAVAELAGARILVTGGAGFVGRSVVPALRAAGATVTVLDRDPYPDGAVPSVVGDLRDRAVRDAAVTPDLSGIVHLAAQTSVLGSLARPALVHEVNVEATAALLELARVRGIPRFLMTSTNAVVGDRGDATLHEDLPLRPLTPYGATKAAAEMLLSGYAGGYAMTTCALRFTNVYGPGMARKDSFVPRIMRAFRDGRPVQVYGTGEQRRDLVHVADVVAGLLVAWRPAIFYIDSVASYLLPLPTLDPTGQDPIGYDFLVLWPVLRLGNVETVAVLQHLMGLGMAVAGYALLRRKGAGRWLATLATVPVLLDAYQVQIEHNLMA